MTRKAIFVTKSSKPRLGLLVRKISSVLRTGIYTNDGPLSRELENLLKAEYRAGQVVLMNNGTSPLLFLLSTLPKGARVLTTPFSFVATTSAIVQSGLEPVFADIDPKSSTVDIHEVKAILRSGDIAAMLFTHVYGQPCDFLSLEELSKEFDVPLFFDGAHAMGVTDAEGASVLTRGTASTISFHATKILSTGEGGALVTSDQKLADEARAWRNFGIVDGEIRSLGVNAKMSEFQAAIGLSNFPGVAKDITRRQSLFKTYRQTFSHPSLSFLASPNGSYFPLLLPDEETLLEFVSACNRMNVFPRRYFYPSLNTISALGLAVQTCPVSENLASRVLCMPSGKDVNSKLVGTLFKELRPLLG